MGQHGVPVLGGRWTLGRGAFLFPGRVSLRIVGIHTKTYGTRVHSCAPQVPCIAFQRDVGGLEPVQGDEVVQ